jgi:hypothetical protein
MITEPRRARRRIWAGLAALLVIPAALGTAVTAAGAAGSNTLTVKAGEYTYQLKGSLKAGWAEFQFVNAGNEAHMMAVFKLKKGVTLAQLKTALLSQDPSGIEKISDGDAPSGTPELLSPKQHTTTIVQVAAGHYGIACFVPAATDGAPHVAHGMLKIFDVKAGVHDVTLTDTGITVPPGDAPRHGTVKITNEGTSSHSFSLIKIENGHTLDEVKAYFDNLFNTGKAEGEAPGSFVAGATSLSPNGIAYLELDLAAGHYGYVSTDGNAPDDDYTKGLHGEFDVK